LTGMICHRITEWPGLEGTSRIMKLQPPTNQAGPPTSPFTRPGELHVGKREVGEEFSSDCNSRRVMRKCYFSQGFLPS